MDSQGDLCLHAYFQKKKSNLVHTRFVSVRSRQEASVTNQPLKCKARRMTERRVKQEKSSPTLHVFKCNGNFILKKDINYPSLFC
ncbi:unnamed protein product [Linum tenue]|uniref:Uncharacterized protein n=1 Tax=Linum tenue TaxID=586396 RepID=A0AAV0I0Y6_9ROSI|nr:unnamed protein product [Linum tenue]